MTEDFAAVWDSETTVIYLSGRFDATQVAKADEALARADGPTDVDFSELVYISSAGIGSLLATHKRLGKSGGLRLLNMNPHLRELFELAGFDTVFEIG